MSYPQTKPQNTSSTKKCLPRTHSAHLGAISALSKMEVSLLKHCKDKESDT